jgi:hypothetical protein
MNYLQRPLKKKLMMVTLLIGHSMKENGGITTYYALSDKRKEGSLRKKKQSFEFILTILTD